MSANDTRAPNDGSVVCVVRHEADVAHRIVFERFVSGGAAPTEVDVWWSDAILLPLRSVVRAGSTVVTTTIDRLDPHADASLLRPGDARFPDYEVLSSSDIRDHRH